MQDLIGALGDNGFKLEKIIYNPTARIGAASALAKFVKDNIRYQNSLGNDESDNSIKVDVQYDIWLDHIHRRNDDNSVNGEIAYGDYDADKAKTYINELMNLPPAERRGGMYSRSKARSKTRSKARSKTRSKARS
jgi:hypothetical protein